MTIKIEVIEFHTAASAAPSINLTSKQMEINEHYYKLLTYADQM